MLLAQAFQLRFSLSTATGNFRPLSFIFCRIASTFRSP